MTKILFTGMSGVGKSTILEHLRSEDAICIDLDYDNWMMFDPACQDYLLDITRITQLIQTDAHKHLFFAGTAVNQKEIYAQLDWVITLTAPLEVMRARLLARTTNPFGKKEEEWQKIIADKERFEPLIIQSSHLTIATDQPLEQTLQKIRRLINSD